MKTKRIFRVLVALSLASAAGRKKLNGIYRFLGEGHCWDMDLVRSESAYSAERLASAPARGFDGILTGIPETPEQRRVHGQLLLPSVFIDYPDPALLKSGAPCVFLHDDTAAIAQEAARHLLSDVRPRSFGFVPARESTRWSRDRAAAFTAQLKRRGEEVEVYSGDGYDREALTDWLKALPRPAALLAAFDDRALDILEVCRATGINVPEEIAVLGIGDDELICENTTPPLSSVAIDFEAEGYRAARELEAMMLRSIRPVHATIACGVREVMTRASTSPGGGAAALVRRAQAFIEAHACEGITVTDVVEHLHVSRRLADLRFRAETGHSILEAILDRRLAEVQRLLTDTDAPIAEIAVKCGYRDANYLKNQFKRRLGTSMREFRKSTR